MQTITPGNAVPVDPDLQKRIDQARSRIGAGLLDDRDMLLLCCAEIMRTYTREEAGYK